MNCNLLNDPWLSVVFTDGRRGMLSLPELFPALQQDTVEDFPALLPHQTHPWHAFLCQLAAMSLEGVDLPDYDPAAPTSLLGEDLPEIWRERLCGLTADFPDDEPWRLLVEDLSKPAFMQPPVPEGSWEVFTRRNENRVEFPDELDVLICSKNHGEKNGRIIVNQAEFWIFALLSLQTQGAYSGKFNYNIARQNGGSASRAGVSLVSSPRVGGQWARDVRTILTNSDWPLRGGLPFDTRQGDKLLWLQPWDGQTSLGIERLHPLFIEICRRVRLQAGPGKEIQAWRTGTRVTRVEADAFKGNLGDPWIPIRVKDGAAYNSRPHYRQIQKVLFDPAEYEPALLQLPSDFDSETLAVRFRFLVMGQSKTEGYYERLVPVPARARSWLTLSKRGDAAQTARDQMELASAAQRKVLKPALLRLMQAARSEVDFKQKETGAWSDACLEAMDRQVDQEFFPYLWQCLERKEAGEDAHAASLPWREYLAELARERFRQAAQGLPVNSSQSYKALVLAEGMLKRLIKKHLEIF